MKTHPLNPIALLVFLFFVISNISCVVDNTASGQNDASLTVTVTVQPAAAGNFLSRQLQIVSNITCALSGKVQTPGETGYGPSDPQTTEQGTTHSLWFYGLLAQTTYTYSIWEADTPDKVLATGEFETSVQPDWAPQPSEVINTDDADPDTWFAMSVNTNKGSGEGVGLILVVDRQGRYRFFHQTENYPGLVHPSFLEGLMILENGDLAWNNRTDIEAVSLAGSDYLLFDVGLKPPHLESSHHQSWVFEGAAPGALVLFNLFGDGVACDLVTPTEQSVGDGVARIDANGQEVWRWSVFDSSDDIPPESLSPCDCDGGFWGPGTYDFSHANSVWPVDDGQAFLVSLRNLSRVVKVDADNGEVIWQLGKGLDFTFVGDQEQADRWFSFQHDAQWHSGNRLLIFDNHRSHKTECEPANWSRAVEYEVDEQAMTVSLVWEHRVASAWANGNNDRLDNGNVLIAGGGNRRLVEVTTDGQEVWSYQFPPTLPNLSTGRGMPALWVTTP